MKSSKVLLCSSPAFPIFSLCSKDKDTTIAFSLIGHQEKNNLNTSKNSTFTLEPNALRITGNTGEQVLTPVEFEVYFDDGTPRITGLMPTTNTVILN